MKQFDVYGDSDEILRVLSTLPQNAEVVIGSGSPETYRDYDFASSSDFEIENSDISTSFSSSSVSSIVEGFKKLPSSIVALDDDYYLKLITQIDNRDEAKNYFQGAGNLRAKKVRCIETGEIFETIKDAAIWAHGSPSSKSAISAVCKGIRNIAMGYHWEYVEV